MKKLKLKKMVVTLALASSLSGAFLFAPNVIQSNIVYADDISTSVPATVNISLHKLMYDQGTTLDVEKNGIVNNGHDQATYPSGVTAYDKSTYGDVGFTLYDITNSFSDGKYTQTKIDSIIADVEKNGTDSTYIKNAPTNTGEKLVDDKGNVTFSNMDSYVNQTYRVYLAVETKTPKGLITQKAKPLVVITPMTTSDGTGYLKTINLYPKNITQKLTFTLTKQGVGTDGKATNLSGAKFQLYSGKAGSGTKIGNPVTSDKNGKLVANDLTLGDYYWVEVPSTVVADPTKTDGDSEKGLYLLGADARNDGNNKLTFSIGADGVETTSLKATFLNYLPPTADKEVTNGTENDSFEIGEEAHYKATINVPVDILGGKDGIDVNGKKTTTLPYGVFNWYDVPQTGLAYVSSKADVVVKDKAGNELSGNGEDYRLVDVKDKDGNVTGFRVDFIINGKVSEKVGILAGQAITIDYDMLITEEAKTATDLLNQWTLSYKNAPGTNSDKDVKTITGQEEVHTFGAKFLKESSGLFGTGVGAEKLEGAEFVVTNSEGKYYAGLKDTDSDKVEEVQWTATKSEAVKLTSNDKGLFEITGLKEGDYQLSEVKAPTGYQLLTESISFKVTKDSYQDENRIMIENDQKPNAPLTGSQHLLIFAGVAGALVLVTGGALIYRKKYYED